MKANSVFPVLHSLPMGMQNRVHDALKQDTKGRYKSMYQDTNKPMTIVAITHPGREYLYYSRSAHKVSKASASYILNVLNQYKHKLHDGEIWHVYNVDSYSMAYDYAQYQRFSIRNGRLIESIG